MVTSKTAEHGDERSSGLGIRLSTDEASCAILVEAMPLDFVGDASANGRSTTLVVDGVDVEMYLCWCYRFASELARSANGNDNPKVHDAMLEALSFWLDMGIDGFRLDAVPYLFERPGTDGENLPETHEFLRKVRRYVDDNYPGRVLLAEANQWPADVVDYFGGAHGPTPAHGSATSATCASTSR